MKKLSYLKVNLLKIYLMMLSSYFFPFSFQNGSKTLKINNQILFFIPNSSYFDEDSIQIEEYKNYYIIGNLGVFIYIEFNEILGDYELFFLKLLLLIIYHRDLLLVKKVNQVNVLNFYYLNKESQILV